MSDKLRLPTRKRMVPNRLLTPEEMITRIKEFNPVSPALQDEFLFMDYHPSPWSIFGMDKGASDYTELFEKVRGLTANHEPKILYFDLEDPYHNKMLPKHMVVGDCMLPMAELHTRCTGSWGIEVVKARDVGVTSSLFKWGSQTGKSLTIGNFLCDDIMYPDLNTEMFSLPNKHNKPYWLKYVPLNIHYNNLPPMWLSTRHIGMSKDKWVREQIYKLMYPEVILGKSSNYVDKYVALNYVFDIEQFPTTESVTKPNLYREASDLPFYHRLRK